MKTLFVICVLVAPVSYSVAQDQDLQFNKYRRSLLNETPQKKMAIDTTCKDKDGVVHRIGEKSYDKCMKAAPKTKNTAPPEESLPSDYNTEDK